MNNDQNDSDEVRKNVLSRLRKIEGQVRGIHNMVETGKKCEDVLIQVRAVKSALRSMTSLMMRAYLLKCFKDVCGTTPSGENAERLDSTIETISRFIED